MILVHKITELQQEVSRGNWGVARQLAEEVLQECREMESKKVVPESIATSIASAFAFEIHPSDVIKLRGVNREGMLILEKHGPYFHVGNGSNRNGYKEWFVRSRRPDRLIGKKGKFAIYEDWIRQEGDERFTIIAHCPVTLPFREKDYDHIV